MRIYKITIMYVDRGLHRHSNFLLPADNEQSAREQAMEVIGGAIITGVQFYASQEELDLADRTATTE